MPFSLLASVTLCLLFALPAFASGYTVEEVTFQSRGVTLAGSIVLPADAPPTAAVVFVHGSGPQERNLALAKHFAEHGIAALVYDKRGVGASGGDYESQQSVSGMNIDLLAADAAAALNALAAHAALANVPLGLTGISQAGWIVPLAAEKTNVADFLLLWSGPVCRVSEEDIYSKYTRDLDGQRVPSYQEALDARETPYVWPGFLGTDTDPATSLSQLDMPGLWIFGANDGSVPVDLSIERLEPLRQAGHAYDYVLFSGVGHNNIGETFATAVAWIDRVVK